MAIIVSTCLQDDWHILNINYSGISFPLSSIADFSEPIFGWEIAFVLFSKTPHIA